MCHFWVSDSHKIKVVANLVHSLYGKLLLPKFSLKHFQIYGTTIVTKYYYKTWGKDIIPTRYYFVMTYYISIDQFQKFN